MIMEMYVVYDRAVQAYLQPVFVRSRGEMLRSFQSAVNSADHQFNKYAADYTLFYVGSYDDASSMFEGVVPERVISALEVLMPVEGDPVLEPPPLNGSRPGRSVSRG